MGLASSVSKFSDAVGEIDVDLLFGGSYQIKCFFVLFRFQLVVNLKELFHPRFPGGVLFSREVVVYTAADYPTLSVGVVTRPTFLLLGVAEEENLSDDGFVG